MIVLSLQQAPNPFLRIHRRTIRGLPQYLKPLQFFSHLGTTVSAMVVEDEVRLHAAVGVPKFTSEFHEEALDLWDIGALGNHVEIAVL